MTTKLKRLINKILRKLNQKFLARPYLRSRLIALSHLLGVYSKLKTLQRTLADTSAYSEDFSQLGWMPTELEQMTPQAKQIYDDLKDAIARQQKGED